MPHHIARYIVQKTVIDFLTHPLPSLSYVHSILQDLPNIYGIFSIFFSSTIISTLVSIIVVSGVVCSKWFPKEYYFHPLHSAPPSLICSTPYRYDGIF